MIFHSILNNYAKILNNLKNFILPKIKGISWTSLDDNNEDLAELWREGLTEDIELATLSGFYRKNPRFTIYLNWVIPRITNEVYIGWFTLSTGDLEKLMQLSSRNLQLCLERCILLAPKNNMAHFTANENEEIEAIK